MLTPSASAIETHASLAQSVSDSGPSDAPDDDADAPPAEDGPIGTLLRDPLMVLFVVIASGLVLGRLTVGGLSLGSSGVIFTALAAGHFGYHVPDGIGTLGLVLFVYCVGLTAGPGFFRVFVREGKTMAQLAVGLVVGGAAVTVVLALLLDIPADLAAGLFAGSLTSTPGLAAGMEAAGPTSQVAVGYGIAYPFGVVGVVLFVQLLPRLLKQDVATLGEQLQTLDNAGREIVRVLVTVENPAVIGKRIDDLPFITETNIQISRVLDSDTLVPLPADFVFEADQDVLVVARAFRIPAAVDMIGKRSEHTGYTLDTATHRMTIVATSKSVVGHTLKDLSLRSKFGVTVARLARHDLEFVPNLSEHIQYGDALITVGEPEALEKFAEFAGHRAKVFDETDLISLSVGLVVGVLVGKISLDLGDSGFALGLSGGPLIVGLLLGHFERVGPITASLPRAARMLMMEIGLVFFLASAGVKAGGSLVDVLATHGVKVAIIAVIVTGAPLLIGCGLAKLFKRTLLQMLGGTCGGMTSTPGLGAITSKTDSDIPVTSYAAAYPVALILMTLCARLIVMIAG